MFLDSVGYTAATHADEARSMELLEEQEALVAPAIAAHQGRLVKSTGDGLLAEFDSALKATQCGIEIQRRLHERNARVGAAPIRVRIGIHLGDVIERGADIFGDAVNIASRIEPLAAPGGICVSGSVRDQVRNKISDVFEALPHAALKGIDSPVEVYRIVLPWSVPAPSTSTSARNRLAVLPLANISPDPKDEYFADGLTEEVTTALSKIPQLRVIARTSVLPYKTATKSVSAIGAELGVSTVLQGSVRKAGNRLRVTLQLIDVASQEHTWSESYDRDLTDVFALQSEIAEKTAGTLRLELLGPQRESLRRRPTSSLAAYNFYLQGLHQLTGLTYESYAASIRFLEQAVQADPNFAGACAMLANQLISLAGETIPAAEAFPRARELIERALALEPDSSEAHLARGNLAFQDERNWALAEAEFRRAIELNPSNAPAHFWYAAILRAFQRFDDALEQLRLASELDPMWERLPVTTGRIYLDAGDFAGAEAQVERSLTRSPGSVDPLLLRSSILIRSGRIEEARRVLEQTDGLVPTLQRLDRAALRALTGDPTEAKECLAEIEHRSPDAGLTTWWVSALYASIGETETALTVLERDAREGSRAGLWFHYLQLAYDPIRGEPRFQRLLQDLGLPVTRPPSRA
jgi:adenylate cyclase